MGTESRKLHVVFFPLMAAGHMIPTLDIAKLFAAHQVKTTIITTPVNAPAFIKPLQRYRNIGPHIDIEIIPFPCKEGGLPEGIENFDQLTSMEMVNKFMNAVEMLEQPLEQVLEKYKPDCLVADLFLSFATQVAAKFNIPRLVSHVTCCFALSVSHAILTYEPQNSVSANDEEFVIPHLPHEIKLARSQLAESLKEKPEQMMEFFRRAMDAEAKSYGVILNSFYELEPDYASYLKNIMSRRVWHIGPVSLCNGENQAKFQRGKDSSVDEHECLKWLDSKKPNSVIYICFGSVAIISASQLQEIALGLEASGQNFIWVVGKSKDIEEDEKEEWLPDGFEKRMEGKGLIIRGWAPQILILDHEAVGGFVTHCGWNSVLEGISSGVPMVTWPVLAEHFYIEKFVTDILKTGISVGSKQYWNRVVEASVKWEEIKGAIERVMVGEEASEIRSRAKNLKEMARKAVEEGGSSSSNLSSLIQELGSFHG